MSNPKYSSALSIEPLQREVRDRFGVLPNFFGLASETPDITRNLWGFAQFGYLDNPMPSLFKERLFVYLSRFCDIRYCIARHVGFLVGLGRPAGDRQCPPEMVEQVVRLIRRPLPRSDALEPHLALLEVGTAPLICLPGSDTQAEEAIFACATHVFLQTPQVARCLEALRRAFDGAMFQHLMVFLTFVRTAHYWTKLHPELGFEDDLKQLFETHEELAQCVLNDPEASACETTQVILEEVYSLRRERALREEMERALEAQRQAEARLAIELAAMTRLHELVTRLLVCRDFRTALDEVLAATMKLLGADMGTVQLFDPESNSLKIVSQSGLPEEFLKRFRTVRDDDGLACNRAVKNGERVLIEDLQTDPAYQLQRPIAASAGYRALLLTPLLDLSRDLLGVLSTYWREPRRPSEHELRIVDLCARQAADVIALDLAEAKTADLFEADRRKTEFLAMLAHELRNPLAPMRNAVEILERSGGDEQKLKLATEMMRRQVSQMVRLVDDLLDVSRISRGKIELRLEPVELASVVDHAVEAVRPLCESMGHELTVELPPQPVYLNADPSRLAQVVANLLNNACKFTEKGGHIRLIVGSDGSEALIRVQDTGIGIAADQLSRIFQMFTQVNTSVERSRDGLGLGLTLVKSLVEMHDGTVEASSVGVDQGSEFVVRLPILAGTPELPPKVPLSEPPRTTHRVLVVDDNRDSAESLAMLVQLAGHETCIAYDGFAAVEAAATFGPEVVLLDIGLPDLNGFDTARRIREQPGGKNMVLVALTGWGQEEDRRKSKDAGFDHHMVKPVDHAVLIRLLAESGTATKTAFRC
jgi:signal transduction histidine kinase/ActR/RegA family two-component response regulator